MVTIRSTSQGKVRQTVQINLIFILPKNRTNNIYNYVFQVIIIPKLSITDVPGNLTIQNIILKDNSLITSWTYEAIPTISVNFNITLTFLSPSQLENITMYVTNTNSYNFTLEGVRSCDPFTMCITATNIVGQSPPSCVNKTLPYIPSTNDIDYSLISMEESYSLNLTIQVLYWTIVAVFNNFVNV